MRLWEIDNHLDLCSAGQLNSLVEQYEKGDAEARAELERVYGANTLKTAVQETASGRWLDQNTKACPKCGAKCEHVDGCNKMTCFKCRMLYAPPPD